MSKELQNLLCNCSSGYIDGISSKYAEQRNDIVDDYNDHYIDCPRYESDRDEKLLNDWKVLDDDSWDVISALRQKFCQLSKSEAEATTVRESQRSSYIHQHRQPYECQSIVERASNLIDYTPESEFLRKIKQQCQYLHNRLPNIFSALNDCLPEGGIYECQRPCSESEKSPPKERLRVAERKSEHVSRSKKPNRHKRIRKRKSNESDKSECENNFEPSLKRPSENSCERCWRYASPARSPVNKPDQRFDPNYRRGHSAANFEKGDGDIENCVQAESRVKDNLGPAAETDFTCQKHICDGASNRSPSVQTPPHICIKQKMEAAVQMRNTCPKHKFSTEPLQSHPPVDFAGLPSTGQHTCPKHRSSLPPSSSPQSQHVCPKHLSMLQQAEAQKHKCPVHEPRSNSPRGSPAKSSPSRGSPPNSPQRLSSAQRSPLPGCSHQRSSPCGPSNQRSPQSAFSQQTSPQSRCSHQRNPPPGPSSGTDQTCKPDSEEASRGVLCSGKKPRPQSCSGIRNAGKCSNDVEDLDTTEYMDICVKARKPSPARSPDPCGRGESTRKSPPCGACPPKPVKTCEHSKLESIPEGKPDDTKDGDTEMKKSKGESLGDLKKSKSDADSKNPPKKKDETPKSKKEPKEKLKEKPPKTKKEPKGKAPKPSPKLNGKDKGRGKCQKNSNQYDKAHPIRHCKCTPRIPETEQFISEDAGGQILCCHCDWKSNKCQSGPAQTGNENHSCSCNASPKSAPNVISPGPPKGGTMECPYRAYMNKFGAGGGLSCSPHEERHWCSRESQDNTGNSPATQDLLECSPRKYFVFYMTKANEKKKNDVEVLVEELAKGVSENEAVSRTKDLAEKMKKISEPQPDSMALRFQKGVTEACNAPQSSRILYF